MFNLHATLQRASHSSVYLDLLRLQLNRIAVHFTNGERISDDALGAADAADPLVAVLFGHGALGSDC